LRLSRVVVTHLDHAKRARLKNRSTSCATIQHRARISRRSLRRSVVRRSARVCSGIHTLNGRSTNKPSYRTSGAGGRAAVGSTPTEFLGSVNPAAPPALVRLRRPATYGIRTVSWPDRGPNVRKRAHGAKRLERRDAPTNRVAEPLPATCPICRHWPENPVEVQVLSSASHT
jgi:hypothetical protein